MNSFFDYHNDQVAKLPLHLKKYIIEQEYDKYTPVDHAVWRYVMRQNYSYLKNVAYYPYIPGLKKAGLTGLFHQQHLWNFRRIVYWSLLLT
jgi:phenylalanine-4-hydroxylase